MTVFCQLSTEGVGNRANLELSKFWLLLRRTNRSRSQDFPSRSRTKPRPKVHSGGICTVFSVIEQPASTEFHVFFTGGGSQGLLRFYEFSLVKSVCAPARALIWQQGSSKNASFLPSCLLGRNSTLTKSRRLNLVLTKYDQIY